MTRLICGMAAMALTCSGAAGPGTEVTIRVETRGLVPTQLLWLAKEHVSEIFAAEGISIHWDKKGSRGFVIELEFVKEKPAGVGERALAHAFPFSKTAPRVVLFYGPVERILRTSPISAPRVLAHIMAHEIGHVLLGTDAHSDAGMMSAHWSRSEMLEMRSRALRFSRVHASMMRENLSRRPANPS